MSPVNTERGSGRDVRTEAVRRGGLRGRVFRLRGLLLALAALTCLGTIGCGFGSKTYPVKGKVVFKEDGKPMTSGMVVFVSASDPSQQASGDIEEDGSFVLGSSTGPGAPAGEYQVLIQPPIPEPGQGSRPIIHPRYLKSDTSGLKFKVPSGDNNFEIKVERPSRR